MEMCHILFLKFLAESVRMTVFLFFVLIIMQDAFCSLLWKKTYFFSGVKSCTLLLLICTFIHRSLEING